MIASCNCLIEVHRWIGQRTTCIGFIISKENFINSMTFTYEDTLGKHYYFDINKIDLTRDVNKALQTTIEYEDNDSYYYISREIVLNKFLGLEANIYPQYCYKDWKDSSITEIIIIPIMKGKTLESTQENLDKSNPPPRKTISKAVRQQVYNKCQGHCAYCGKEISIKDMQVDHVVSHMGNKGKDDINNYLPACKLCNHAKCTYTIKDFRSYIEQDAPRIHFKKNRKICGDGAIADRIVKAYNLHQTDNKVTFYFEKLLNESIN